MSNTLPPNASDFFAAAGHLERAILEAFVAQGNLIQASGALIHALQRERGASNLYVGSGSGHHDELRLALASETDSSAACFSRALPDPAAIEHTLLSHRLLIQFATALQALEGLALVREQITQRQISPAAVIHAYSQIVHALLCVVFEIADMAAEPAMARTLIALVNIMQCKELAGQERATGTAAFAGAGINTALIRHWQQLIDAQEQSLDIFQRFADAEAQQLYQQIMQLPEDGEFERLRRRACTSTTDTHFQAHVGERWFQLASQRMDVLKTVEDYLISLLQQQCARRLASTAPETIMTVQAADNSYFVVLGTAVDLKPFDEAPVHGYHNDAISPRIGRTMIELLYQQSRRLQEAETELESTRHALAEGKLVAKAKALLMKQRNLTEEQAHRLLQKVAMNQNRTLYDVADLLLALENKS